MKVPNSKPLIRPLENGPLEVENLDLFTTSRDEKIVTEHPMQLCRCGQSRTKPFCDGRQPDLKEHYRGTNITIQENRGALRYIGIRHEGAAAFAASGYAKASGKPTACLSIAGPGATNLLTGLWDAKLDRVPVLALTGQVQTQFFGPGAFQEIDLPDAFHGVADFSQTVLPSSRHAELMSLALKHAILNRDVAHLIFPDEVQTIDAGIEAPDYPDGRLMSRSIIRPTEALQEAGYRLGASRKQVVIVGFGARDAMPAVLKFAETLNAPVLTTFKAKPIIQVDYNPMALGKFHAVSTPVLGDCAVSASMLTDLIDGRTPREDTAKEISSLWQAWNREKSRRAGLERGRGLSSALIFDRLSDVVAQDALIAVDVGNNTHSYGRYFRCRNQRTIMSGYLGSIGFSFPAAMGAWAAGTGRRIISVSGDGGFGQYMNEFLTAVKYNMNSTHILLNNNELGKISKEQRGGGWDVWKTELKNPFFAKYASNCGGFGIHVDTAGKLDAALAAAIDYEGPSLVEITSDPELI